MAMPGNVVAEASTVRALRVLALKKRRWLREFRCLSSGDLPADPAKEAEASEKSQEGQGLGCGLL